MTPRAEAGALLLILMAATLAMLPTLLRGPVTTDSFFETQSWSVQFTQALAQGVIYPRWLPRSFAGLGAPVFYFYPPLPFYAVAAVTALTGGRLDPFYDVAGAAWALLALSGWTMRLWLRRVGGQPLFALAYLAAPYHLLDFGLRGDLAEFAAFAVLPLVMLGLDGLERPGRGAILSVAYAALIAIHLPMALIVSALLVAPTLLLRPAMIRRAAVFLLLGIGLAAVYLAPALALQGAVAMDKMQAAAFRPGHWYVWRWPELSAVGRMLLVLAAMWLAAAGLARNRWAALAALAALCVIGLPPLLSAPLLARVQFPWRALAVAEFAGVTALALAPGRPAAIAGLAIPALGLALVLALHPDAGRQAAEAAAMRGFAEAPEYAPAGALPGIRAGDVLDTRAYVAGLRQRFPQARPDALAAAPPGEHVFLKYFFPALRVLCDGAPAPTHPSPGDRLLAFRGGGDCRAVLAPLPVERWGLAASATAAGLLALAALLPRRRRPAMEPRPA